MMTSTRKEISKEVNQNLWALLLTGLLFASPGISVAMAAQVVQTPKEAQYAEENKNTIYPGDTCITTDAVMGVIALADLKETETAAAVGDNDGILQLAAKEKLALLAKNTKVLVIDCKLVDWGSTFERVRILTGHNAHAAVWIIKERLKPVTRGEVYKCGIPQ